MIKSTTHITNFYGKYNIDITYYTLKVSYGITKNVLQPKQILRPHWDFLYNIFRLS